MCQELLKDYEKEDDHLLEEWHENENVSPSIKPEEHEEKCCDEHTVIWKVAHALLFLTGGTTFTAGSTCYFFSQWANGGLWAAVLYTIGRIRVRVRAVSVSWECNTLD